MYVLNVTNSNNVEFKHIQGASPELVLYDENEEVYRVLYYNII